MSESNGLVTQGQIFAIRKLIQIDIRPIRLKVISNLIGREISSFKDVTKQEWETLRDEAYPEPGIWQTAPAFQQKLMALTQAALSEHFEAESE